METTDLSIIEFDNKLNEMMRNEIQGEDAERFIMNFHLYLVYRDDPKKFVVDLDNIWEWLGFTRKDNAKRLIIKTFELDTDYEIKNLPLPKEGHGHGGHNKEIILMNVETFKHMCMLANTEKGKRTRKYYSRMETIFFKFLEEKNRIKVLALKYDLKKQSAWEMHKKLVDSHKKTNLVYIILVQEIDGETYIIKIGETGDIEQRLKSLRKENSMCLLMDVFPCANAHAFEQYILHRNDINKHKVGTETIKISSEFPYKEVIRIMKKHVDKFDGLNPIQKLEIARMKHKEHEMKHREFILNYTSNMEDIEMKNKLLLSISSDTSNMDVPSNLINSYSESDSEEQQQPKDRHRRVFKYQPEDLHIPIQTFMSLREAARSLKNPNVHDYHIRNASLHNTVCEGFRWYFSDDEMEPPPTIPDTTVEDTEKPEYKKGLVAQISLDKKTIVNVFPNQKDVTKTMKITSGHISIAISKGKLASNFYWDMYENCSSELKATFKDPLPKPIRVGTCSKTVQRIDPETNEVLETYACIQEVASKYKICHKTLNKLSDTSDIYKGFKWQIVE